jgi:NAD-dependent dihydropyrimidine dehydrogenase PreA subunit
MNSNISTMFLFLIAAVILLGFGSFMLVSLQEGEKRAAKVSAVCASGGLVLFCITVFLSLSLQTWLAILLLTLLLIGFLLYWLPFEKPDMSHDIPRHQVDERDIMFARARLVPETPPYLAYYEMHPENKAGDDLFRSKPGLLSPQSMYANPFLFALPAGSFFLTEALSRVEESPVPAHRYSLEPYKIAQFIKSLARYYGALNVGITELQPYHIYSHIGRGSGEYGTPIDLRHRYAITFTVEMDIDMISAAPQAQCVVESAHQYVEAARVAVQLAAAIRNLGYSARAHIDGDYRVLCTLVARDAGLGEIGRMGLLMTPHHGPRVRLAVVTTDLELITDKRQPDPTIIDFCSICKKCAYNCPVKAIPFGDRQEVDGALRWRINSDICFRYWSVVGTDCGRCMSVCPYSHPDNFFHNLVRFGNKYSGGFRRLSLRMDDLFYGKIPNQPHPPSWTDLI